MSPVASQTTYLVKLMRIAEGYGDRAVAGQGRDFRKRSARLNEAANECMPECMHTHARQLCLFRRANDRHTHLFQ